MVYLLKVVIFHGELLNKQMVSNFNLVDVIGLNQNHLHGIWDV